MLFSRFNGAAFSVGLDAVEGVLSRVDACSDAAVSSFFGSGLIWDEVASLGRFEGIVGFDLVAAGAGGGREPVLRCSHIRTNPLMNAIAQGKKYLDILILNHAPLPSVFQRILLRMVAHSLATDIRQDIEILQHRLLQAVDIYRRYRLKSGFCI